MIGVPKRSLDIILEKDALGILSGTERWYLFLDGVTSIHKYRKDIWTNEHWNKREGLFYE